MFQTISTLTGREMDEAKLFLKPFALRAFATSGTADDKNYVDAFQWTVSYFRFGQRQVDEVPQLTNCFLILIIGRMFFEIFLFSCTRYFSTVLLLAYGVE